jgi:hypothetical protein
MFSAARDTNSAIIGIPILANQQIVQNNNEIGRGSIAICKLRHNLLITVQGENPLLHTKHRE